MYLSRAENYDKDRAESWKADADGILIFERLCFPFYFMHTSPEARYYCKRWPNLTVGQTGLFSAIVAAFVIEGLKNLQPDTGSSSVDLLSQISQQLAASRTHPSHLSLSLTVPPLIPLRLRY